MTEHWAGQDWALFITAIGTLVTTLTSSIAVIIAGLNNSNSKRNSAAIEQVRRATNGLKAELVESTRTGALAEGEIKGRADVKEEIASGQTIVRAR